MRAAEQAAEALRDRLDCRAVPGRRRHDALVKRFAADARRRLFGTLSLWQGVDVPGPSLSW